ncbi:MAG: tripartite tricarboxylate transporter substrate binding protein [Betaproteobacteria bacterium]|nr:tripartite tricarboxylate transporter substrate binding protein [Betaproteobacteria bacterium]
MIGWKRLVLLAACAAAVSHTHAQVAKWPQRPVRVIVPLAPGGSVDMVARLLSTRLTEQFGQQFIVDNRSGGGATIGTAIVARAQPDGHTILMMSGAFASSAALYKLPYDPIKDFAPIARVAVGPLFLTVHPSINAHNLAEFLDLARSKPAVINYGSGGTGTTTHLATEYFQQATGIRLTHVPYKGIGAAIGDLLGGQIQMYLAPGGAVLSHVKTGRLRALAQTSEQRLPTMPDLPAVAEVAPGFAATFPYAMGAPAGTPQQIVLRLNAAIGRALEQPEIVERLRALGLEPAHSTPQALMQAVTREIAIWTKVVKVGGITIN